MLLPPSSIPKIISFPLSHIQAIVNPPNTHREELAELTAPFTLPPLSPAAPFNPSQFSQLGAFPPLLPRYPFGSLVHPSPFFGSSSAGSSSSIATTGPRPRHFHAHSHGHSHGHSHHCPAHPANRPPNTPRQAALAPSANTPASTFTSARPNSAFTSQLSNSISASNPTSQAQIILPPLLPRIPSRASDFPPLPTWGNPRPPSGFGATPTSSHREPNSDDYSLNELLTRDFSSPSIRGQSPRDTNSSGQPEAQASRSGSGGNQRETSPTRSTPSPTGDMSSRRATRRGTRSDAAPVVTGGLTFPSSPAITRTRSGQTTRQEALTAAAASSAKRKRGPEEAFKIEDDDVFGDGLEIVDLADTEEVPASMLEMPKPKNETKLGAFQCVICMDNVTDLTVTHCGKSKRFAGGSCSHC